MSAAFKRGRTFYVRFPLENGSSIRIATGTTSRTTANAIRAMAVKLAGRKEWTLLKTVTSAASLKARRHALERLYRADALGELEQLRTTLNDVDLTEHLDAWQNTLRARLSTASRMVDRYRAVVETLVIPGQPFPRSALTPAAIAAWQASPPSVARRMKSGQSMRIQRRLALSSFCTYLVETGILARNPVRDLRGAGKAGVKVVWLPDADMHRLIDALPEPYRTLELLLHATGIEIGTALRLRKRDVILEQRAIRAPGSKNANRDRVARVRAFGWERIVSYVRDMLPGALLFDGVTYELAPRAHVAAIRATGLPSDYTLHSSRHSFAVQLLQESVPAQLIASNLGHRDTTMVTTVYGRYSPAVDEWSRWEANVARTDEAKRGQK